MEVFEKIFGIAKNIGEKTGGAIEQTKLEMRISAQKRAIEDVYRQLGALYYEKHVGDPDLEADECLFFEQIQEIEGIIAEMQARVAEIIDASGAPLDPSKKRCEGCGSVISVKAKFCYECGAKNPDAELEPAPEATEKSEDAVEPENDRKEAAIEPLPEQAKDDVTPVSEADSPMQKIIDDDNLKEIAGDPVSEKDVDLVLSETVIQSPETE